jgi:hypothetical protein
METGKNVTADSPDDSHEGNPLNAISGAKAEKVLEILQRINLEIGELSDDTPLQTDSKTDDT